MTYQSSREASLHRTLFVLIRGLGLMPEEVARLRLSDLHLAGKDPSITFGSTEGGSSRAIALDLETHRVLVGWLVARPDSASDFLVLNENSKPMDPLDIEQAVETFEQADLDLESKPATADESEDILEPEKPSVAEDFGKGAARSATTVSPPQPVPTIPPPSAPEMGTPPPGFTPVQPLSPFLQPPSSAPEQDEETSIPTSFPPNVEDAVGIEPAVFTAEGPGRLPHAVSPEKSERMPKSVRPKQVRVPPKPVRKKDAGPTPVILQRKGSDQPGGGEIAPPEATIISDQAVVVSQPGRPVMLPVAAGGAVVALLLCVVCVAGTSWFAWQNETGQALLAGLGLFQREPTPEVGVDAASAPAVIVTAQTPDLATSELTDSSLNSPLATPTLPPTNTPTLLPPTHTPLPTETATPVPEEVQPPPTDTPVPVPTDTPLPPDTPSPQPPPATQVPTETPTPAVTPTPTLKYQAPVLTEPKNDANFIAGNTIVLRWQPVGPLAPDEQYAVRMIYPYNGQPTYQGGQTKATEWIVPLSLYGQIDPPDNRYEWFVVVERLNDDGSGTAISPESERWRFVWR